MFDSFRHHDFSAYSAVGSAHASGAWGRWFESSYADYPFRGVAQMVERLLWEQDVAGSSPATPICRRSSVGRAAHL